MKWLIWIILALGVFLAVHLLMQLLLPTPQSQRSHKITIQSEFLAYRYHHQNGSKHEKKRPFEQGSLIINPFIPSDNFPEWDNFSLSASIANQLQEASVNNTVIVSIVDNDYYAFAINFYELSIRKLGFTHFVPICIDEEVSGRMDDYGILCPYLGNDLSLGVGTSDFGTQSYYRKTNLKTIVMAEILRLNLNVLMVDLDVIIFKDPFPYFTCQDCDLHFQMDREMYNSGFVFAKPTPAARQLYSVAWQLYVKYHKAHDQAYINMAIRQLHQSRSLKIHELSRHIFPCGVYYFEQDGRQFFNEPSCEKCVMAHNNYIGSVAAKKYRFKENLLWVVDDESYYSNSSVKYLMYASDVVFNDERIAIKMEALALRNALYIAHLLQRILILPSFRCCNCRTLTCDHPRHKCSLLTMVRIKTFDEYFQGKYREHAFLKHSLVPDQVKHSTSPLLVIDSIKPLIQSQSNSSITTLTDASLIQWLRPHKDSSVIRFQSMYGPLSFENLTFVQRIEYAMECSTYEQWDASQEHL